MTTMHVVKKNSRILLQMLAAFSFWAAMISPAAGEVKADYLYNLSDFNGAVPCSWVKFAVDRERKEIYVSNPSDSTVRVFNDAGMELYSFGDDGEMGNIRDLTLDGNGNLLVLSGLGEGFTVIRADFRGEQKGKMTFSNLPPGYLSGFSPDRILYRDGTLYLVDRNAKRVLVTDQQGAYKTGYDLREILKLTEKKKQDATIIGFTVDRDGDLLFTIPVFFMAYVVSPDHKVRSFGVSGSSPGKFNIIGGIVTDSKGFIYVADTLRCVVSVFNKKDFSFKGDFGYRGLDPGGLVAPMELAAMNDKIYVTQSMNRGVSVYKVFAE